MAESILTTRNAAPPLTEDIIKSIILAAHPIGSFYWSENSTSPKELFGGEWEQIKDKFVLAAGDTYTAGATGGEASHTLTANEMPAHSHDQYFYGSTLNGSTGTNDLVVFATNILRTSTGIAYNEQQPTGSAGNNVAHNNMPPYITAYCWKRTA